MTINNEPLVAIDKKIVVLQNARFLINQQELNIIEAINKPINYYTNIDLDAAKMYLTNYVHVSLFPFASLEEWNSFYNPLCKDHKMNKILWIDWIIHCLEEDKLDMLFRFEIEKKRENEKKLFKQLKHKKMFMILLIMFICTFISVASISIIDSDNMLLNYFVVVAVWIMGGIQIKELDCAEKLM